MKKFKKMKYQNQKIKIKMMKALSKRKKMMKKRNLQMLKKVEESLAYNSKIKIIVIITTKEEKILIQPIVEPLKEEA